VLNSVVKVRTKGKDKVTISTSVIGALFCQESDQTLPLFVAIGHSLHQQEGISTLVPVLLRRDTTSDKVDKIYEHKLEGQHMLPADLIRECNLDSRNLDDSDCAPVGITPKIKSFSLNWTRVSKLHARGTSKPPKSMACCRS
jgi:hypothetical protein